MLSPPAQLVAVVEKIPVTKPHQSTPAVTLEICLQHLRASEGP